MVYRKPNIGYGEINEKLDIWHPMPNMKVKRFHKRGKVYFEQTTDSEGFRIIPDSSKESTNRENKSLNILMLGDSFTWGHAVSDNETYPYYTYKMLQESFPEFDIKVKNGANIWMTINEQLAVYNYLSEKNKYDIITLCFCPINDLSELSVIQKRKKALSETPPAVGYLMKKNALLRLLHRLSMAKGRSGFQQKGMKDYKRNKVKYHEEYRKLFEELIRKTEENKQILIGFSTNIGKIRPYNPKDAKFFIDMITENGAYYLPIKYVSDDYLSYDPHFSPKGNMNVARQLVTFIKNKKLLDK